MKLLKIENHLGMYLNKEGGYSTIDKITKEDLLRLVEGILEGTGELEPYEEDEIKNQAHQVVYKSIYNNLKALDERKQEFKDESERLYIDDYKKYVEDVAQQTHTL
jgi:hypothetical protein